MNFPLRKGRIKEREKMKKGASIRFSGIKVRLRGLGLVVACLLSAWTAKGNGGPGMLPADTTEVAPVGDTLREYFALEKDTVSKQVSQKTQQGKDSLLALRAMERILGLPSDTVEAATGQTLTQDSAQVVLSPRASDTGEGPGDTLAPAAELVFAPADSSAASYVVSQVERDSLRRRDAQIKAALASLYGISINDTPESELGPKTLADTLMAADAYQAKVYDNLPQPTQPPYVKIATPVRFTLDNGLKVLVYPDSSVPVVTFYIGISNRRVFEKDKKGVSDLTAAMLLAGVQNRTKAQITDSLANMGSRYRMTRSSFYVSGLSRYATQNFNLFADVVLRPSFPLQEFFAEKQAMKDDYALADTRPNEIINRVYRALAFGGKIPSGEFASPQTIDRITVNDCQEYYSTYWRPNNAVLLVLGDITEAQARKLVEGRFRFWGKAEVPQDKISSVNDLPSTAIDFIHDPSARDSRIIISNIAEFDYNSPDVFPAMIINHLMGGDLLGNIQASLGAAPQSENVFLLSPDPLGGYMYLSVRVPNLDAVRTITEKTARLQSIRRTPLDSTTLASVKQYLIGRIALSFEDREAMGSYGVAVENGTVKQDFLEDILRQINDVTSEDVMRVAQKYIKPSQFRIVIYGDARKVVPPLELAGYDVTFYDKTAQRVARPSLSQPITDSISVRDVLERYFEAMGGEKKMRAVKTFRQQYDILIGDRKLQAVVLARLPFYYQQLLLFDDEVYLKTTYNGNMGYTKVENTTTALSADAVEKGRLSRSIFPLLDYEKEGFQAELDSIVPVLGHFTYRMNVTLPEGKMQNYYFSTEDYRVLRIEEVASRAVKETDENGRVTRYEPEKIASYSDYRDYKEVDGVMYPFTTEIRDESGRIIWKTTSVDPGVSIPEKVFR